MKDHPVLPLVENRLIHVKNVLLLSSPIAFDTDLESDVTVLSLIKRAVKETIEEKCLTAKAAMNRVKARRRGKKSKNLTSRQHFPVVYTPLYTN